MTWLRPAHSRRKTVNLLVLLFSVTAALPVMAQALTGRWEAIQMGPRGEYKVTFETAAA
jgi:hypothetical protein